jgi:hypothetical protein
LAASTSMLAFDPDDPERTARVAPLLAALVARGGD